MPLNPNVLTTIEAVKEELRIPGSDRDNILTRYINAASDSIEQHCNRSFFFESARVERHKGKGTQFIVADKRPVLGVTTLTIDQPLVEGPLIEGDGFEIQDQGETGIIFRVNGWPWRTAVATPITRDPAPQEEQDNITMTYICGYVTPEQVRVDQALPVPVGLIRTLPASLEDACILAVATRANSQGQDLRIKQEKLLSHSVTYTDASQSSHRYG